MSSPGGWERRFVDGVLRLRWVVLVAVAAITVVAGFFASKVRFDSDIEMWFLEGDESLAEYHEFLGHFSGDELAILGVFADDVLTPDMLAAIQRITRDAAEIPGVLKVRSVTNVRVVESRGSGTVAMGDLVAKLPESPEEAAALRARVLGNTLVRGTLVAEGGDATAIIVELDSRRGAADPPEEGEPAPAPDDEWGEDEDFGEDDEWGSLEDDAEGQEAPDAPAAAPAEPRPKVETQAVPLEAKVEIVRGLSALAEEHLPAGTEWHMAGTPPLDEAFFRYSERDFMVFTPLAVLLVLLISLLLFRRLSAALVPLAVVGIASIWTFGLMGAVGVDVNLITTALFALILAVGVADSIHVLSDYYRALGSGLERHEAVAHSVADLLVPCLFTSATTAAGFMSLLVSDLAPVRELGWLAAGGVGLAFLLSVTLIPVLLRIIRPPSAEFLARRQDGPISRVLGWLGRQSRAVSIRIVLAGVCLLVGSGWALTQLEIGANALNYFLPGDPVRTGLERVDQALGGSATLELFVTTSDGGLKDPAVLERLSTLADDIEGRPGVSRVLSILDYLRETHRLFAGGDPQATEGALPSSREQAAQLYFVIEGDRDVRELMRGDYSITRMTARVRLDEADELTADADSLYGMLAEHYNDDELRVKATGFVKLMSEMEHYLFDSQVESLMVAFVVITLMMLLLLRSVRLGLLSMIPNLLPIAMGLGFMALVGIPLDPGTVMIGCMALGLVVDDTVHMLVRLRRNLEIHELPAAVEHSLAQTGRPIVVTTIILAAGFSILSLGSFTPNVAFGQVSAVVVILALVCDLALLPAVMLLVRPKLR